MGPGQEKKNQQKEKEEEEDEVKGLPSENACHHCSACRLVMEVQACMASLSLHGPAKVSRCNY